MKGLIGGNMYVSYISESVTEFELSGLNADELEYMRAEERREVLRSAGLNPEEYDF